MLSNLEILTKDGDLRTKAQLFLTEPSKFNQLSAPICTSKLSDKSSSLRSPSQLTNDKSFCVNSSLSNKNSLTTEITEL